MPTSRNPVLITDLVLRDAHQSLLATRMRTHDIAAIADVDAEHRVLERVHLAMTDRFYTRPVLTLTDVRGLAQVGEAGLGEVAGLAYRPLVLTLCAQPIAALPVDPSGGHQLEQLLRRLVGSGQVLRFLRPRVAGIVLPHVHVRIDRERLERAA